jgi:hypothetical protein
MRPSCRAWLCCGVVADAHIETHRDSGVSDRSGHAFARTARTSNLHWTVRRPPTARPGPESAYGIPVSNGRRAAQHAGRPCTTDTNAVRSVRASAGRGSMYRPRRGNSSRARTAERRAAAGLAEVLARRRASSPAHSLGEWPVPARLRSARDRPDVLTPSGDSQARASTAPSGTSILCGTWWMFPLYRVSVRSGLPIRNRLTVAPCGTVAQPVVDHPVVAQVRDAGCTRPRVSESQLSA